MSVRTLVAVATIVAVFEANAAVCPTKVSICGVDARKIDPVATIKNAALYACSMVAGKPVLRKTVDCPFTASDTPTGCRVMGSGFADECLALGRPPLWEHGWAMINILEGETTEADFPFAPPALYPTACGVNETCETIARAGLLFGAHPTPAEAGHPIPLSYHNDAGAACQGCAEQESCSLDVCIPDYTRVGFGWDFANAAFLPVDKSIEWTITPSTDDPEWGRGAFAAELATVIMGDGNSTSDDIGTIEIYRTDDDPKKPEKIPLTLANVRDYAAGPPKAKPSLATELYSAPCRSPGIKAGRTCFLDMQHFTFSAANQARAIVRIRIVAHQPLRVHALSLRPARKVIVMPNGEPITVRYQGACSAGGPDRTGGRPFSIPCTTDADCDGGDVKCTPGVGGPGSCDIVWGTGRNLGNIGCVVSSVSMLLNYYGVALPNFIEVGGAVTPLKKAPHTPGTLNRWLGRQPALGGKGIFDDIITGHARTALSNQLAYIPQVCRKKAGGEIEPKPEFADALGDLDALAFCTAASPIADEWLPDVLGATALLKEGAYVEVAPSAHAGYFQQKANACGGQPVTQRPVLRAGGKIVALLEIEEHPLRTSATCKKPAPKTETDSEVMKKFKDFSSPKFDPVTRLPCTSNYVGRVVHVLDATYRLSDDGSEETVAFVEAALGRIATALNLTHEVFSAGSLPADQPANYGDMLGTLAARYVESSDPVILRVKPNSSNFQKGYHSVLGIGVDSQWFPDSLDEPFFGLRTSPSGAWQGSLVVNDPQLGAVGTLYSANYPKPADPGDHDKEANAFVNFTEMRPKSAFTPGHTVVQILTHSPALALMTALNGTRTGWLPNGQGPLSETAGGRLDITGEDFADEATVQEAGDDERYRAITLVDPPAGLLRLDLTGTAPGPVTVDIVVSDPDGGRQALIVQFPAQRDRVVSFDINVPSASGGVLIVSPRSPIDVDGDGIAPPADCNDGSPGVNPRAIEDCDDGIDNDCDSLTDSADIECEDPEPCPDRDSDGYFDCGEKGCDPTGLLCGDCNDFESTVNPSRGEHADAPVICSDGLDNDCDGLTDDVADVTTGEVERACLRLPYPEVGDPCALDIQCGDFLFCDNLLGGGLPTFSCQNRKAAGSPCFKSDACAGGQCGLGQCCASAAGCPSLDLFLGKSLGSVSLVNVLPNGCYGGSAVVTPCTSLPFCNMNVQACKEGTAWKTVSVSATANAGPLGSVLISGDWDDTGKSCLEGNATNPTGLPLNLQDLHLTVCEDGAGGATLSVEGTTSVSGKPVSFTGEIVTVGSNWTMTLHTDSVQLGSLTVSDVTLTLAKGVGTVAFSGRLREPASDLDLHVTGSYSDAGPVTLALALDAGASWSPAPGVTFDALSGSLVRNAAGVWTATILADTVIALGPLPAVQVGGELQIDGATGRISGCLDAKASVVQGSPTIGLPLQNVTVSLCVNDGGSGRVEAKVTGKTTVFGKADVDFAGTLGLGTVWHLSLGLVGDITLGGFTGKSSSLEIRGSGTQVSHIGFVTHIQIGAGASRLDLTASGGYADTGAMSLALALTSPTIGWTPISGVTFFQVGGTIDRSAAGAVSGMITLDANVNLGPITGIAVRGDLAFTPSLVSGCLSADAARDQGSRVLGPLTLQHLAAQLCLNQGNPAVTSATLVGEVSLFGAAPTDFSGSVVLGDPWSLALTLTNFPALGPIALDSATVRGKPATAGGVDLTLDVAMTLGTGTSALALIASGGFVSSGPMTFSVSNTAVWTPVPGLVIDKVTGTVTRQASGAVTASLDVSTKVDLGPIAQVQLTGHLDVDTATERITGCLSAAASDLTVAGVVIQGAVVTACLGHDGVAPTFTGSVDGKVVVFGDTANAVTIHGTITTTPTKTISIALTGLKLSPFTLDTATLTLTQPPTGPATAKFDGILTFGTGPGALKIRAFGDNGLGNVTLQVALVQPWTPAPGFKVDTASGTLSRTAGVWSASFSFTTTVTFGPFGSFTVTATNVSLNGATKSITFDATVSGKQAPTIVGVSFTNLTIGVHVETSPAGLVSAVGTLTGKVRLFGVDVTITSSTLSLTDPFVATLNVGPLTLGGFTLNNAKLTLTHPSNGPTSITVAGESTFGQGPQALTIKADGAYVSSGDVDLNVSMKPNTTWTPAPGVTVTTVTGNLKKVGALATAKLTLGASVVVGPLGTVNLVGDLSFNGGNSFIGCFGTSGTPLGTLPIGGVSLSQLTAQACMVSDASGKSSMNFKLGGKASLQGGASGFFDGTLTLAETGYTAILTIRDLLLSGFSSPTSTLTIVQGASGLPNITLVGRVVVGNGPAALTLDVNGSYKTATGFSLALSIPPAPAPPWRPATGIEVRTLTGTMTFANNAYSIAFGGTTTTTVAVPILGDLTVTGTFTASVVDGKASVGGCLSTSLPLAKLASLPGLGAGATATAKVCLSNTETPDVSVSIVGNFEPLKGLKVTTVTGQLKFLPPATSGGQPTPQLLFHVGPVAWTPVSGFSVTNAVMDATFSPGGPWSITASGTTTFSVGGFNLSLAIAGSLSADQHIRLSGTFPGTLKPLQALGPALDFLSLANPTVELDINTAGAGAITVTLSGNVSVDLFGVRVTANIRGGATLGGNAAFFFTGDVTPGDKNNDGQPDPIQLPGFPPITGKLCFGAATLDQDSISFCGKTVKLKKGLTLYSESDLPVKLVENQPKASLLVNLESLTHLTIEASLDFDWTLIKKTDGLPTIDTVTLNSLSLFANIDGANVTLGFGTKMQFKPSNQVTPIQGVSQISFTPPSTIGALLFLNGRWLEPLGLPKIAIQSPGLDIGITIPPPPAVPVPTRFGIQADLFWLKKDSFPAEIANNPEKCGNFTDDDKDGKTDCADTKCAGLDLYCVPNVATIGGTLFFDTIPTESGICIGPCLPLPTILVRFILKSFGLEDVARILNDVRAGAVGVMTSFNAVIGQALGSVAVPTVSFSPLSASINELSFYVSTHNKELFGDRYGAGLAAKLDVTVNEKKLLLAGAVDSNGLLIQGQASPFKLLGVDLLGNPFARIATPKTGDILVAHDIALDGPVRTVEAWVKRATWSTTALSATSAIASVIASKESGTDGWSIGLGEAVDGKAKVIVRLRKSGSPERVARTAAVVAPSIGTHVAVTFEPSDANTRVVVRVNGEVMPLFARVTTSTGPITAPDSGLNSFGPVNTTQGLVLGKGIDELDDVRLWKVVRPAALIAGQARVMPAEFIANPDLIARWEFDYDSGTTANNSKVVTGATTPTGRLHGAYRTPATSAVSAEGQDLFFKLGLLLNGGAENGLFAQAGIDMPLPLGGSIKAASMIQIGAGAAAGRMYAKDIQLLDLPFFGKLMLGGLGPNGVADDFDDGLFAAFDLLKMTFTGSARLAQVRPDGTKQVFAQGTASLLCASASDCKLGSQHVLSASGSVDLTAKLPDPLGQTGIQGAGSFSTATQRLDVNGKVVIGGKQFASGTVKVTPTAVDVTASISLVILGLDLGSVSLTMKLDFAAKTFCGNGAYNPPNGSPLKGKGACSVDACFGTSTTLAVTCGGVQFCLDNSNCTNSKVCVVGFCSPPLANGVGCFFANQCSNGGCGGLLPVCYTPLSKIKDAGCILGTLDQCQAGLICLPNASGNGVCVALNLPGAFPCTDTAQCAAGLVCRAGTTFGAQNPVKQCLRSNIPDGSTCANDVECKPQHVCFPGIPQKCACNGDSTCPSGEYCDFSCIAKKGIGSACSGANRCTSGACSNGLFDGVCYARNTKTINQSCVANDHCVSNFCSSDVCKCDADTDCSTTQHCDNHACVGPVGEGAGCQTNRWCTGTTPCLSTGDATKPKACLTPSSKAMGAACVADVQCVSGRCPGADLLGKTCKCDSNNDCSSTKFCDLFVGDTADCANKRADFADCSSGTQCTGGSCGGGLFKKCQTADTRESGETCVSDTHCAGSRRCDGVCYLPDSRGVGQSCVNGDHCSGNNVCLLGTCRCNSDNDCNSSSFCDFLAGGFCKAKAIGGQICGIVDEVCASNKCTWGFCACFDQNDCPNSKYCEDQYCKDKKSNGSNCTLDRHCDSNDCRNVDGFFGPHGECHP